MYDFGRGQFDISGNPNGLKKVNSIPTKVNLPPFKSMSGWIRKGMVVIMPTFSKTYQTHPPNTTNINYYKLLFINNIIIYKKKYI